MSGMSTKSQPSSKGLAELISAEAEYTRRAIIGVGLTAVSVLIVMSLPILQVFLEGNDKVIALLLPAIFATVGFGIGLYLMLSTIKYEDRIKELRKCFGTMQFEPEEKADQKV